MGKRSEKERLANAAFGIENDRVMMAPSIEDERNSAAIEEHDSHIEEYKNMLDMNDMEREEAAQAIREKYGDAMEILPTNRYILVKTYDRNPYQQLKRSESGIIIDTGGVAPTMVDPNDGVEKEMEMAVVVGHVIEVAPDSTSGIKEGDDVFYRKANLVPVPFFGQGLEVVHENTVIAVVNAGLKKRFNIQ